MQDSRSPRIAKAVQLGTQIRELEDERELLLLPHDEQKKELKSVDRKLDLLWLEVGKLKHASGE